MLVISARPLAIAYWSSVCHIEKKLTSFSVITVTVSFTESDTDWAGNAVIICLNALGIWHRLKNKTQRQVETKISVLGLIKVIRECGQ